MIRVRDAKRSSAILVPRTFRTPYTDVSIPTRVASRIYEEVEFERRVEFDFSWNAARDDGYQIGSPPGPWIRRENLREWKDKNDVREKLKDSKKSEKKNLKEEKGGKETKGAGKEMEVAKEARKGQAPPTSALHGRKYPIPQPKSILKRRTEPQSPGTSQQLRSSSTSQQKSGNTSQQAHSPTTSSHDFKSPAEISFVGEVRPPIDRGKGAPFVTFLISISWRTLESSLEETKHASITNNIVRSSTTT